MLRALAELNFPLVITTNYDQLFEKALARVNKKPCVSVYNPHENVETKDYLYDNAAALNAEEKSAEQEKVPSVEQPFLVKVHGDISDRDSLVITDEDYINFVWRMGHKAPYNPIPLTFRNYFVKWPTLFIGYSLTDYNLRLLFITLRWKIDKASFPPTYSVDPYPDPLILDFWQNQRKYVTFIAEDVWTFVPKLYERITNKEMPR